MSINIYNRNIDRKKYKTLSQVEQNVLKNYFAQIGYVEEVDNDKAIVILIPSVPERSLDLYDDNSYKNTSYKGGLQRNPIEAKYNYNTKIKAVVPVNMDVRKDDIVLIIFTDIDFRSTLEEIKKSGLRSNNHYKKDSVIRHSHEFGIITNVVYRI